MCIEDDAVNVKFYADDGDFWGAWIAGIVEAVTAGGHADAVGFYFL